ncbi:MAG: hypothetical protein LBH30_05510 [Prevotellaceae bacterium]|jgi:hypothetical protein|nr:hypothetical protein [Prevotellaceae bacterium]
MTQDEILHALSKLGDNLNEWLHNKNVKMKPKNAVELAIFENEWFTVENIRQMISSISQQMLDAEKLNNWIRRYETPQKPPKRVGIIAAGNIPLVFFHDFICVLVSKNIAVVKFSSKDKILSESIINMLVEIEPRLENYIEITENRHFAVDAVIATGNDNTVKFFKESFGEIPHVFRKNRTSAAILNGNETSDELELLCNDIFSFFGLGCRNVSKLFVPDNYDFASLVKASKRFSHIKNHKPYENAYIYNKALLTVTEKPFIDNDFWLLTENFEIFSPVSVIYYEKYINLESLKKMLSDKTEHIQCIVNGNVDFGKSQQPQLFDYADGVDIMDFLLKQI